MNKNYITQLNKKTVSSRKNGYNPKYNYKKNQYYRKTPNWLQCKHRLINVRGIYLKHLYSNLHRVIIYKYMHVMLVWWYILSQRYLQFLHHVHYIQLWCEYYGCNATAQHIVLHKDNNLSHYCASAVANTYRWAIGSFKAKKRGLYLRKRSRRAGFFRIRRKVQSYGRYLPPKQYALLKAFYSPSNVAQWEDKFTLPLNIVKLRSIITQPRGGYERKRYLFINFTAFTVRERSKSYLYYTNLK